MTLISIITPVYNSPATLRAYLNGIRSSIYKEFELILIDDGSHQDFQDIFKGVPVIFKKLDQRQGAYYARNIGAKDAKGDILFFLDADIVIAPDTLGRIVETFQQQPQISVLIGSYDDNPGAKNLVSQFKFLCHHYVHQHEHEYLGSFWAGCGAIKREIFEQLGGFNAKFFQELNTVNDIDFGYRLKRQGFKVYNARHIQVQHLKRLSFMEWIKTDIFQRGLPWMKILMQYRDFSPTLNVNFLSTLSVCCVWFIILLVILSFWMKGLWLFECLAGFVFLGCNSDLLKFFIQKRGVVFLLGAIPLLFIYYFNCGLCILMFPILYRKI